MNARWIWLVGIALAAAPGVATAKRGHVLIDAQSADAHLRPGDVLVKFLGVGQQKAQWTSKLIQGGQRATRFLVGMFNKGLRRGDPAGFHTALYLGNGELAEAHGGSLSTAKVGVRTLDAHRGYLFQVYRPMGEALARRAADIARRWANGRMKYSLPVAVPLRWAKVGIRAKKEALQLAKAADTAGGPPAAKKMFCSQFVVAVYQAAHLNPDGRGPTTRNAKKIRLPVAIRSHASHTSPLYLHAQLQHALRDGTWTRRPDVLVRPAMSIADAADRARQAAERAPAADLTARVERLGTPTKAQYPSGDRRYARNPWSLFPFAGRLFIGSGNSNNKGPAKNAGPVHVWAYDLETGAFVDEGVVEDEQVDRFRVVRGALVVPGHDPAGSFFGKGSWLKGNFYRRERGGWKKVPTLPGGIHNYDMLEQGRTVFAGLGTPLGALVARSEDGGKTWKKHLLPGKFRVRTFFRAGEKLLVSTSGAGVYEWSGKGFVKFIGEIFPGFDKNARKKIYVQKAAWTPTSTAYIVARKLIDHDGAPLGLYATTNGYDARAVTLPHGMQARDVVAVGDTHFVLAWGDGVVAVYASKDLVALTEVLRFKAPTFARSMALLPDERGRADFYFGLGSEPDALHDATGEIWRLRGVTLPR